MKRKQITAAIAAVLPVLPNYTAVEHLEAMYRACWFSIWQGKPINDGLALCAQAGGR